MKIDVSEYEKNYTFELKSVTQLCGRNVMRKTYILESIKRYFSTYKYRDEKNKWRDNVRIDNKIVSRKFFTVISISRISELLMVIKLSKHSLMTAYMQQLMQRFDWQTHLRNINIELEEMFRTMNINLNQIGDIELTYAMSDIWEMIQKSDIIGKNQEILEDKDNYELFIIFLNLFEEVIKTNPKKMLVIIENMDHLIAQDEYRDILVKMDNIGRKYGVHFIVSSSIDGYAWCDRDRCSGISIFGDVDFQMPEFEEIVSFIREYYPCNKRISEEQIQNRLKKIIQKIGQAEFLCSVEENVICKQINQTLMLSEKLEESENALEMAFLKS